MLTVLVDGTKVSAVTSRTSNDWHVISCIRAPDIFAAVDLADLVNISRRAGVHCWDTE